MQEEIKDIQPFLQALKEKSDYDFTNYSMNSLNRRVIKIMNDFRLGFDELVHRIKEEKDFREEVVRKITVHTTDLFRDAELWHHLRDEVIPKYAGKKKISIWHPGCSTGQEVYSMMILLNEMKLLGKAVIFASDLNPNVLKISKQGIYKFIFNKDYVSNFDAVINSRPGKKPTRHDKYFEIDRSADEIIMKEFLRQKPVYREMDLVKEDNPFKQNFDIIVCRNVIIYFNYALQNKVIEMFYNNMNENACLVLGLHESIIGINSQKFIKKEKVYYKKQ